MICPNCKYEDRYSGDSGGNQGSHGDFFQSTMARNVPIHHYEPAVIKLIGCPKCLTAFLSKEKY
jgi:protein-arginine kinase activator protein McsA